MVAVPAMGPSEGGPSTPIPAAPRQRHVGPGRKPHTISSLHIPVPGACRPSKTKLPPEIQVPPVSHPVQEPPVSKRAPRKAKDAALIAIHQDRSESPSPAPTGGPSTLSRGMVSINAPSVAYPRSSTAIKNPKLDMQYIKQPGMMKVPEHEGPHGVFGLEDCPAFYPTEAEFKDPMRYIMSISGTASQYGICKIVPPNTWRMPFVTDTETFRFTTRLQRLNSMEATARDRINFMVKLNQFHKQQGDSRVTVPIIAGRSVDLWQFKKEVQELGGYDAVTRDRKWSYVGSKLGYVTSTPLSTQLRTAYGRIIQPYEIYEQKVKSSPGRSPVSPFRGTTAQQSSGSPSPSRMSRFTRTSSTSKPGLGIRSPSPNQEPPSPQTDPDNDFESEEGQSESDSPKPEDKASAATENKDEEMDVDPSTPPPAEQRESLSVTPERPERPLRPGDVCEVCRIDCDGDRMLLCDGCDAAYHTYCLDPPIKVIPKSQWFCHACLFGTGGDYGFDEGEEHSLTSFYLRDSAFQRMWFETLHPPPPRDDIKDPTTRGVGFVQVTEDDVEREFWRLIESREENVEVEYGADVHSTIHGSASPTPETHPLEPASRDGWNLNNLAILPESLLRYIKSDISGMTIPWIYVGMLFSTFCWHNEDHYTYSVNYMHWGETKTWYAIPGEDADKFEVAIKEAAPDLFESQPDLIYHLTTLLSPARLKKAGVRVFRCNQRAGEFIVTFPQAYHSGFNHGFNLNEAVNFALPDWLPRDLACVRRYQHHNKAPVFSHDELLMTITQHSSSVRTAIWLEIPMKEMQLRELVARQKLLDTMPGMEESIDPADKPEDQTQCRFCNAFCYLSQITCSCNPYVVCLDHADELCPCPPYQKTLRKRISDEELSGLAARIADRAAVPTLWRQKFHKQLAEASRPPLASLRALVAEGERIATELPELVSLKRCLDRANRWAEEASVFTYRKVQSRRQKVRKTRRSAVEEREVETPPPDTESLKGVEEIERLIREYDTLGVKSGEFRLLLDIREQAMNFAVNARAALQRSTEEDNITECEALVAQGSTLNVRLQEFTVLDKRVKRVHFLRELEKLPSRLLSLGEVIAYMERAHACGVPPSHPLLLDLESQRVAGEAWRNRAERCLGSVPIFLVDLEEAIARPDWVPVDTLLMGQLENLRSRAKVLDAQAKIVLTHTPVNGEPLPTLDDVRKFLAKAEGLSSPYLARLESLVDKAADLEIAFETLLTQPPGALDVNKRPRGLPHLRKTSDFAEEHLCVHFKLPWVEHMIAELDEHESWLLEIPDWLTSDPKQHPEVLLRDIVTQLRHKKRPLPHDCSCICTEPSSFPGNTMRCDNCYARFHAVCNMHTCPFCDSSAWNTAPLEGTRRQTPFAALEEITARAPILTRRLWPDYFFMSEIVEHCRGFRDELTNYINRQHGLEDIYRIRSYLRTLYWLYVDWDGSDKPDATPMAQSLSKLYRAMVDLFRNELTTPEPPRKRLPARKPKLFFREDEMFCICDSADLSYPIIRCSMCSKDYHREHVGMIGLLDDGWKCMLCCVRLGRDYMGREVGVLMPDSTNLYLDYKETIRQGGDAKTIESADRRGAYAIQLSKFVAGIRADDDEAMEPSANGSPTKLDGPYDSDNRRSDSPTRPHKKRRTSEMVSFPGTDATRQPPYAPQYGQGNRISIPTLPGSAGPGEATSASNSTSSKQATPAP